MIQSPFIYNMSDRDLEVGFTGGHIKSTGKPIRGYFQLLEDLVWHQETDIWNYPKEVYFNKGHVELNIFK